MELGNMVFGNSRGRYEFPDRSLVDSKEWKQLMRVLQMDYHGNSDLYSPCVTEYGGYRNNTFEIMPYYLGEDEAIMELPNFKYFPTGFEIQWYKYPFRNSYMNQPLTSEQILEIFRKCIKSV